MGDYFNVDNSAALAGYPGDPPDDDPDHCLLCGQSVIGVGAECVCPECPECGVSGDPECYENGHMAKGNRAFTIADLAQHVGTYHDDAASVSKALFKGTRCGISFSTWDDTCGHGVSVAGYAEGSGDASCEPIVFQFPFDLTEFDKGVEQADQEGCDLFDECHCCRCGAETGFEEFAVPCDDCNCSQCGIDLRPDDPDVKADPAIRERELLGVTLSYASGYDLVPCTQCMARGMRPDAGDAGAGEGGGS